MQPQSRDRDPSPASSSFAGLLAALTSGKAKPAAPAAEPHSSWTDGLADDVATLSYERAIEQYTRSRGDGAPFRPHDYFAEQPSLVTAGRQELHQASTAPPEPCKAELQAAAPVREENRLEQSRKRASVTVRLTESEYAQLHERATEAGMTVSAYLRSCTFEAESLRAQVKQTLAELRATAQQTPAKQRAGIGWLRLPGRHAT